MNITKGDIFKIVRVYEDKVFLKRNNTGDIEMFPLKVLNSKWELAYSITIHNSQGQSFNNVCVVQQELKGFDMRLLYTAISRAKNNLITLFSKDVLKKLELITGNLHIKAENMKKIYRTELMEDIEDTEDINEMLNKVIKYKSEIAQNDFNNTNIFQSNRVKYKDIQNIQVPTTDKKMEYTGWYGKSIEEASNEVKLNNYLISEFKHNQNFGVHRDVLEQLGYEIPGRYDNQEIIVATGVKEHYESVLNKLCDRMQ